MVIGLTGGIGSGKSMVAKLFEMLGCAVFNSDEVAKEVYYDPAVKTKVVALLGAESYLNEQLINKSYISSKIFDNTDLLHKLNAIIHPEVISRSKAFALKHPNQLIIKETALLFEAKLEKEMDKIIFVESPDELRIERIMKRDGISKEMVLKKIKSQLPQEDKIKHSDFVIHNNEKDSLIEQVLVLHQKLILLKVS